MSPERREKVVILGGGMAALTAALALTRPVDGDRFAWQRRIESITVYQQGWRLGGKGASGRNRAQRDRIEEHGLHLWLGFYENAFRVMQECYAELGRPFDLAFTKASFVVLQEFHDGRWKDWAIHYPEDDRVPGVPDSRDGLLGVGDYVRRALELMARLARNGGLPEAPARHDVVTMLGPDVLPHASIELLAADVSVRMRAAEPAALSTAIELATLMDRHPAVVGLVDVYLGWARGWLPGGDRGRRLWAVLDLVGAVVKGLVRDVLPGGGFEAIDHLDARDWMRRNGASEAAVNSPFVIGGYDLTFAYEDGDPSRPRIAAGQAVRLLMRMLFEYKGAIFWRMEGGMGDVVFAPLWEVLEGRGVDFRFFHRVDALSPDATGTSIEAVKISRQVALSEPGVPYVPVITVNGAPCWPTEPRYDQLRDPDAVRGHNLESFWDPWTHDPHDTITLQAGRDFDHLVFGIPLGAIPYVCRDLVQHNPRWDAMVRNVKTVQTQAFQLWLTEDAEALGWKREQATASGYVEPFDTYADMRHLIPRESWPEPAPKSIAYFCNAMPELRPAPDPPNPAFAAAEDARVKVNAIAFLRRHSRHFWPNAVDPQTGDFDWKLLAGSNGRSGVARFDSQFWRANVDPSERYVQSLPGTNRYRIKPGDTGYRNLVVCGDWTDCGLNAGCIEAAAMSGFLAAHAVAATAGNIGGHDASPAVASAGLGFHGAVFGAAATADGARTARDLVPLPIRDDGVQRIIAMRDPVLRNLWITTAYNQLADGMGHVLGATNLSWCAIATWASKTVGRWIRGELLPGVLRQELRSSREYQLLIAPLSERLSGRVELLRVDRHVESSILSLENDVLALFNGAIREVSRLTAEGNHSVFSELGPLFARMVSLFERGRPDDSAIQAFLDSVRSIDDDGHGNDRNTKHLRRGFACFVDGWRLTDADPRAELTLLGNGLLALTEQTRLQPYIRGAMNAPFGGSAIWPFVADPAGSFDLRVDVLVGGWASALPPGDPMRAQLEAQRVAFAAGLRTIWEQAVTRLFMTLELPGESLRLGADVPLLDGVQFPPELVTIESSELAAFLDEYDLARHRPRRGSAAGNWAELVDRMNYIVTLFRSRQQQEVLRTRTPYSEEQLEAMQQGRIPAGLL